MTRPERLTLERLTLGLHTITVSHRYEPDVPANEFRQGRSTHSLARRARMRNPSVKRSRCICDGTPNSSVIRRSGSRQRTGVPGSSVHAVGVPWIDPAHFLAPGRHAGQPWPGPRTMSGQRRPEEMLPSSARSYHPGSLPQGRRIRLALAIADGATQPPTSPRIARKGGSHAGSPCRILC